MQTAEDRFREMERTKHFAETNWQSSMVSAEKRGRAEGRAEGFREAEIKYQAQLAELKAIINQLKNP